MTSAYADIYAIVRRIPPGQISSYGRIARLAGRPGHARMVGYALHALRNEGEHGDVPWWRVVNTSGRISNAYESELQRALLEAEGVIVDEQLRIDLERFLWRE